ncbi:MAG: MATE family efflux transporter [Elainellaceae cyanobacterium]
MTITTNLYWRFLRLSLFNILSNLMVPIAGLVDTAFLGHLDDIRYLAGVAIATVIFNYLYWSFGFLRMSTTGLVAQASGRGDTRAVFIIGLRHGAIALALGLGLVLLQVPLREIGFWLLRAEPDIQQAGVVFYNARIWGAPATLINFVLIGWFLGREAGRQVLLLSIVGNATNVLLDYLMIYRLGWGSGGAGLATAASQYVMLAVGLGLLLPHRRSLRSPWSELWDGAALRRVFQLNGNILLRTFALLTAFGLFTNLSAAFGKNILAANTLMLQVLTLSAYFVDGLAFATESLVGGLMGQTTAGDQPRVSDKPRRPQFLTLLYGAGGISLAVGLVFAAAFNLFPLALFGVLTDHADVLTQLQRMTLWLLPLLGFGAIAFMLDGYFLGLTAGRVLRNSSIVAVLVGFLPAAIVAHQLQNIHILWLAMTLFMVSRAATLALQVPVTLATLTLTAPGSIQR